MTFTLQHPQPKRPPRRQQIRDLFNAMGGVGDLDELCNTALNIGVLTPQEYMDKAKSGFKKEVREALKEPDASGLPFAVSTPQVSAIGKPIWKRRDLCEVPDYQHNVSLLGRQEAAVHTQ